MMKFMTMALFAMMAVGCASKGDLQALSARVDSLEAAHKTMAADHEAMKADHEAIKGEHSDLKAVLDRAFAKKAMK